MLQKQEKTEVSRQLDNSKVPFEYFLPMQKNTTAIVPEKINWKELENLGLSR